MEKKQANTPQITKTLDPYYSEKGWGSTNARDHYGIVPTAQ
jgi:hypothetical protein